MSEPAGIWAHWLDSEELKDALVRFADDVSLEFPVSEDTVLRWANDTVRPSHRLQALVVASLRKRLDAEAAAQSSEARSAAALTAIERWRAVDPQRRARVIGFLRELAWSTSSAAADLLEASAPHSDADDTQPDSPKAKRATVPPAEAEVTLATAKKGIPPDQERALMERVARAVVSMDPNELAELAHPYSRVQVRSQIGQMLPLIAKAIRAMSLEAP